MRIKPKDQYLFVNFVFIQYLTKIFEKSQLCITHSIFQLLSPPSKLKLERLYCI